MSALVDNAEKNADLLLVKWLYDSGCWLWQSCHYCAVCIFHVRCPMHIFPCE